VTQPETIPAPPSPDTDTLTSAGRPIYSVDSFGTLVYPALHDLAAPSPQPRWWEKADAFAAGWLKDVGHAASLPAVALGLAQAQHETLCGDAWPGEHNWGAVQHRRPTAAELAILAGLAPSPSTVAAARKLLSDAVAAGSVPAPDHCALHVDSSPLLPPPRWYWMFFWAFPDDLGGAELFTRQITVNRPACCQILSQATGDWSPECESFSAALYASRYYEGVNDPRTPAGRQRNIDDYAGALLRLAPGIASALASWTPGAVPPAPPTPAPPTPVRTVVSIADVQRALNALKGLGTPLDVDGVLGPKTRAAVQAFQVLAKIAVDGDPGPQTRAALQAAVDKLGTA